MIFDYYASRSGTRRNLAAMRAAGFRLLLSSADVLRPEGFPYGLDNGKWSAHTTGKPWDENRFRFMVEHFAEGADWLVIPDVVGQGSESLELTRQWLPILRGRCKLLLIATQDGMRPDDLQDLIEPGIGLFHGGSTEWKLSTMKLWGAFAHEKRSHFHVARVNTAKRMALAIASGAKSADGSSASRFSKTVPMLRNAIHQPDLYSPGRS